MKPFADIKKLAQCFAQHGRPGRLVVFEGIPGAGKTTILSLLARERIMTTFPELNHLTHPGNIQLDEYFLKSWYLQHELCRQASILNELALQNLVVQDRNVIGVLAYAYARAIMQHREEEFTDFMDQVVGLMTDRFVLPNLLIILLVDEDVSLKRRRVFSVDPRYTLWFDPTFLKHYSAFYRYYAGEIIPAVTTMLDTTNHSAEAIVSEIRSHFQ